MLALPVGLHPEIGHSSLTPFKAPAARDYWLDTTTSWEAHRYREAQPLLEAVIYPTTTTPALGYQVDLRHPHPFSKRSTT